jgi:pSer/pThr/pTyr-binding forkhead associated (FHA) protein
VLPTIVTPPAPDAIPAPSIEAEPISATPSAPDLEKSSPPPLPFPETTAPPAPPASPPGISVPPVTPATQLQQQSAQLIHVQTNAVVELPQNLSVIHLGKPNDLVPPDVDVSGFPNSEIVSRKHADIRVEADAFYIEDVGSSNGTYINNIPLSQGNRHRLRPGDRISLGKGDLVSFIFQMA